LNWLEAIFCGGKIREINRLKTEVSNLQVVMNNYKADCDKYKDLLSEEKTKNRILQAQNGQLEAQVIGLTAETEALLNQVEGLIERNKKLQADADWYKERMRTLENALEDSVIIPDIPLNQEDLTLYKFEGWPFQTYDTKLADIEYYMLPYDKWVEILTPIQEEVSKALGRYKPSVNDCDDFAYVMGASVALFFTNAGIDRQGAFMVVWDITGANRHAYNAFMDDTGTAWIYESQNGEIIGKLGETPDPYDSNWVWFPSEMTR